MDLLGHILLILLHISVSDLQHDSGRLSVYAPGDGWNRGKLSCRDAPFTESQVHIARRDWWRHGCGRKVLVIAAGGRVALAEVRDSGPWGAYRGPLRGAQPEGRWKVFAGAQRLPEGWKWRAAADLSVGLWRKLGKPRGLSRVDLVFLPRWARVGVRLEAAWYRFWRTLRPTAGV